MILEVLVFTVLLLLVGAWAGFALSFATDLMIGAYATTNVDGSSEGIEDELWRVVIFLTIIALLGIALTAVVISPHLRLGFVGIATLWAGFVGSSAIVSRLRKLRPINLPRNTRQVLVALCVLMVLVMALGLLALAAAWTNLAVSFGPVLTMQLIYIVRGLAQLYRPIDPRVETT